MCLLPHPPADELKCCALDRGGVLGSRVRYLPFLQAYPCNQHKMTNPQRYLNLHTRTYVVTVLGEGKRLSPDEIQPLVNDLPA